jgi:hypothetical protein
MFMAMTLGPPSGMATAIMVIATIVLLIYQTMRLIKLELDEEEDSDWKDRA